MSLIATEADYNGGWYDPPYREYPVFSARAQRFLAHVTGSDYRILVAGCGYGYLVRLLRETHNVQTWGFDASAYAITQGEAQMPAMAPFLAVADATNRSSLNALRAGFGFANNFRWNLVVTEDLLPCAQSDAEVDAMLTELARVSTSMAHVVTAVELDAPRDPRFLWKTPEEWRALIPASQPILTTETGREL